MGLILTLTFGFTTRRAGPLTNRRGDGPVAVLHLVEVPSRVRDQASVPECAHGLACGRADVHLLHAGKVRVSALRPPVEECRVSTSCALEIPADGLCQFRWTIGE